ncbi:hypothetical protein [Chthoniobacter flavus]|nr:hypothetical protein [Chthoniobacter flavus]
MADETAPRPAETPHGGGRGGGDHREQSPLQARAAFFENWSWELVIGFNRTACARGRAQHGLNPEAEGACCADWESRRSCEISLGEALDFLRSFHRRAPFLFFNGNTFADAGRRICEAIFADLPSIRRRAIASAVGHYIAGVLDRGSMVQVIEELWQTAQLQPGDRVKTLKGTLHGIITRVLEDGRVAWRPDGAASELMALPESLEPEKH